MKSKYFKVTNKDKSCLIPTGGMSFEDFKAFLEKNHCRYSTVEEVEIEDEFKVEE